MRQLPVYVDRDYYVPLETVIDFGISVHPLTKFVDAKSIFSGQHGAWNVLDVTAEHHVANTIWTIQSSKQNGGKSEQQILNIRDTLAPFQNFDVFSGSFVDDDMFRLTYSSSIRQVAQQIMNNFGDYAAMHLCLGDGRYARQDMGRVMADVLNNIFSQVVESVSLTQPNTDSAIYRILVITDLQELSQLDVWNFRTEQMTAKLEENFGISVKFVYASDYRKQVTRLSLQLGNPNVDICIDMQLAACAPLGFGYNQMQGSTFCQPNTIHENTPRNYMYIVREARVELAIGYDIVRMTRIKSLRVLISFHTLEHSM